MSNFDLSRAKSHAAIPKNNAHPRNASPVLLWALTIALTLIGLAAATAAAQALTPSPDEKAKLKACEQRLCGIINARKSSAETLDCNLDKTWDRTKIKKGAGTKALKWGFGDARCQLAVDIPQRMIVSALTAKKYSLKLAPQTVDCEVEMKEGVKPVKVTLAPKISFKDGKAYKAWLNVKDVNGPGSIKGLIVTTAKLEDSIGIFHSTIIKSINKFVHEQCPKKYSQK